MKSIEARQFLDQFPRFEVKPGLARIRRLLDFVGQPHLAYPTVHVGGTNGKGSVVAMLDAVLRHSGLRVGRFTSPDLLDFRDRIVVNGEWISEDELAEGVARLAPAIDALDDVPSQFEIVTALAFDHLARSDIDIGVIEVGLGGRFDATNVVRPEAAILTNVTLDHQAILGETVEEIAWEKAGIAKADTPLLIGELPASVHEIVRTECEKTGAILRPVASVDVRRLSRDWDSATYRVTWDGADRTLELPLVGAAQGANLRLVLGAITELRLRGFAVPDEAVVEGLRTAQWPGRLEVAQEHPTIVLDGAHNPAAARALAADIVDLVPKPECRSLLYGTLADKDANAVLAALRAGFPTIGICSSASQRALPTDQLVEKAHEHFRQVAQYHSIDEGIRTWLSQASAEDVLVVTGSLTVVGEARCLLMEGN
ncbi:bifunctional folylpolyglutamate synthase/dihydrofolate synthase [Candidatus Bipolaricaulota bacterium]